MRSCFEVLRSPAKLLFGARVSLLVFVLTGVKSDAAEIRRLGRPGGDRLSIAATFDVNGNGVLEKQERVAARLAVHNARKERAIADLMSRDRDGDGKITETEMSSGRRRRGSSFSALDADGNGGLDAKEIAESVYRARSSSVDPSMLAQALQVHPGGEIEHGASLYDESVLRTFFLQFEDDEWMDEMHDFYRTDVPVPADLTVGGRVYPSVGVRYRGNSSFGSVPPDLKRSMDIAINHGDADQRLMGYKTINLLNAHDDPTFMREVLYSRICRDYMPAFKANFVRVVINGENWGIYPNVQQYNNDFLKEWFGSRGGVRWKGRGSLTYEGPEVERYESRYLVKTDNAPKEAWDALIELCRLLKDVPDEDLEETLNPILDIDGALWSVALENIFVDEGYLIRGSDYNLFRDVNGRFHLLQHDGNEVLNRPGGPGIPRGMDATKMPLYHEADNERRPLVHRLLSHPRYRARYTAHVRTILNDWLHWEKMGPIVAGYRALIAEEVERDVRKESSYEDFDRGDVETVKGGRVLGIKQFVDRRRAYLLDQPELQVDPPTVSDLSVGVATAGQPVPVRVTLEPSERESAVALYWSLDPHQPFVEMKLDEATHQTDRAGTKSVFVGELPAQPLHSQVYYYVEASTAADDLVVAYFPRKAESAPLNYRVRAARPGVSDVVINEVLGENKKTVTDPQGEYDDYIELYNRGSDPIDLAGMFLTDSRTNLRKYRFPEGSWIAPRGFLIVWADEDGSASPGLHANFKISAKGEIIRLIDRDDRGNRLLGEVRVPALEADRSYSRSAGGDSQFQIGKPTPGSRN